MDILLDLDHGGNGYRCLPPDLLLAAGVPADVVLVAVKTTLKTWVDLRAEEIRARIATPGAGQAMEYQEAQAQAFAALASPGTATAERYPMLAASIGFDRDPQTGAPAVDVLGVARSVQAAYSLWLSAGAAIRRTRLSGKAAIDAADTVEAAVTAYAAISWPALI